MFVVAYVEQNGWVEQSELDKAPLSEGVNFIDLFDMKQSGELVNAIKAVKNNALYLGA